MGITLFAGEAEGRAEQLLRDVAAGTLKPDLQFHGRSAGPRRRGAADPAAGFRQADARQSVELRCGTRLSVPVLVLHHHQCAGTQVALPLARRRGADPAPELGAGRRPVLHHRRQFRPQQGLGSDLRPDHRAARARQDGRPLHDPGGHALPQDPELHHQGEARGRDPHLHRAREHQSGEPARGEEAAEQDHRIPQDAARVESRGHLDLCGLYPRLPQRHAGVDPPRHRDREARASARHPRVLRAHAAAGIGRPQGARGQGRSRWMPISTNTISSTSSPRIRR